MFKHYEELYHIWFPELEVKVKSEREVFLEKKNLQGRKPKTKAKRK